MAELFNNYFTRVFTQEDLSTTPVLQLETQPLLRYNYILAILGCYGYCITPGSPKWPEKGWSREIRRNLSLKVIK